MSAPSTANINQSDNPTRVTANHQPAHEEEEVTACFRLKRGMAVFSLSQRSHRSHLSGHIHLENMSIQYDWAPHSTVRVYKHRPRAAEETYEFDSFLGGPDEEDYTFLQMKDFLTAYLDGLPMPVTMADGIQAYRLTRAIRESYKSRREVAIPPPETF